MEVKCAMPTIKLSNYQTIILIFDTSWGGVVIVLLYKLYIL